MNVIYYQTMGLTINYKLERISKTVVMTDFKSMQSVSGLIQVQRYTCCTSCIYHSNFSPAVPSKKRYILCKTSNI